MQRLASRTLANIPPAVRRPQYDRAALQIGMAHIGVGAFHRCHQAEYVDDMLEARFGPWGLVGINLFPPRLSRPPRPPGLSLFAHASRWRSRRNAGNWFNQARHRRPGCRERRGRRRCAGRARDQSRDDDCDGKGLLPHSRFGGSRPREPQRSRPISGAHFHLALC